MNQPSNLITDYLLFFQATYFGVAMWKQFLEKRQTTHFCWSIAFFFVGLASLAGGTFHGFDHIWDHQVTAALWKTTIYSVGVLSFFLLIGNAYATFGEFGRKLFLGIGCLKAVFFGIWMFSRDDFLFVIIEYATTMVMVIAILLKNSNRSAMKWIISGIAVSFFGAGLQQAKVSLSINFDESDIYHVIQLGANFLLWKGAMQLRDFVPQVVAPKLG
jgi:hypothetical protein